MGLLLIGAPCLLPRLGVTTPSISGSCLAWANPRFAEASWTRARATPKFLLLAMASLINASRVRSLKCPHQLFSTRALSSEMIIEFKSTCGPEPECVILLQNEGGFIPEDWYGSGCAQ